MINDIHIQTRTHISQDVICKREKLSVPLRGYFGKRLGQRALEGGTLQDKETVKEAPAGCWPTALRRSNQTELCIKGNGNNSSVKVLGLDCVTCIRLMINIFIVQSPIWQFLDYSLLYLFVKITPLGSSILIATNLGRLDYGRDPRRSWRQRILVNPIFSRRPHPSPCSDAGA